MGPFQVSNGYSYILLAVDYVSRWVEAITTKTNDAKVVVDFLKSNIFCRFGVPKVLISDQGSHFCNRSMSSLLHKYGVVHRIATAYHPQTNGQDEGNKEDAVKDDQSQQEGLELTLWAHRTAYQTLLGMSPYWIIFGKVCHLLVEIEHKAYWAVKHYNLAYDQVGKKRKFQLQELDELCLEAYENSRIYKQKVKLARKYSCKLHSRWDGPFVITNVFPYGVVELKEEHTNNTFQIKLFHEGPTPTAGDMETISLMEPALLDDTL
ncbi:Gag-Pol polyprotein, partial [Mucuna pruriens]